MVFLHILGELEVNPLRANPTKWSKHTQIIRRQFADELLECI